MKEREENVFSVRIQAQGSGVEKSVVLHQSYPITSEQIIMGLENLKSLLTANELKLRNQAIDNARKWVLRISEQSRGVPQGTGKSFWNKGTAPSKARIDIEILRGHNLYQ